MSSPPQPSPKISGINLPAEKNASGTDSLKRKSIATSVTELGNRQIKSSQQSIQQDGKGNASDPDLQKTVHVKFSETDTAPKKKKKRDVETDNHDEDEEQTEVVYGAKHVIMLFIPVTCCMGFVVTTISTISYYTEQGDSYLPYTPFHSKTEDTYTKIWESSANALIFLCLVVVMTTVLFILYKYRFYKLIHAWLVLSSFVILFGISFGYLIVVVGAFHISLDFITGVIIIWNFGVGGFIVIHWKGPLLVQQAYLIIISGFLALMFVKMLPGWTTWTILSALVFWDLVAVLCPKGPLKLLVEMAQSRDEPIFPALIYSSTMVWTIAMGDNEEDPVMHDVEEDREDGFNNELASSSTSNEPQGAKNNVGAFGDINNSGDDRKSTCVDESNKASVSEQPAPKKKKKKRAKRESGSEQEEERGIKLGLGDFIFYGVLVGKASTYGDWNTTLACFVAILIGLCCTLILLAILRKALPALPISLTFGLVFYFATRTVVQPFMDCITAKQIFI